MKYKDLQKKAEKLGLKYIGVSKKDLVKSIKEAENKTKEPEAPKPSEEPRKPPKNANAAVVYDGKNEVRRYTLDIHGKGFAKLAKEFVKDRNYTVKMVEVKPGVVCPSCGHKFDS